MKKRNRIYTIGFDFDACKFVGLTASQVEIWERLYKNTDVLTALVEMCRWIDKNKGKKITKKKDWKTFITNWLKKEQIKAVGL